MVFARETSGPLTSLVKKLDEASVKNKDRHLGSFVVFLSDDAGTAEKVIALAQKEKIAETILALGEAAGPAGYEVAAEADVTVVLYVERTVKANYAFKKGKMTADDVTRIVADVSKIVPSK
jgi:hypothetical protein